MKKMVVVFQVMLLVVFSSCGDVYTHYYLNIDNQTNDTVRLFFFEKSPYAKIDSDSLIFFPKRKKMLYGAEGRASSNGCDYTGIKENEVIIHTSSGRKIQKKIWDSNNWICEGSQNKGWTLTFVITENDLK